MLSISAMYQTGKISAGDYNAADTLKKDSSSVSSLSLLKAIDAEMNKHQQEIEKVSMTYQKLGYETTDIENKLEPLKNAYLEVSNAATASVDVRIQKELEYKKVLQNTNATLTTDTKNSQDGNKLAKDNLATIQEYISVQKELNNLYKGQVKSGFSSESAERIKLLEERIGKLKKEAREARKFIDLLYQVGDIDGATKSSADTLMKQGLRDSRAGLSGALNDQLKEHQADVGRIEAKYREWGLATDEIESKLDALKRGLRELDNVQNSSIAERIEAEEAFQRKLSETETALKTEAAIYKGRFSGKKIGTFPDFESAKQAALEYASSLGKITKELSYTENPPGEINTMTTQIRTASGEVKNLVFNWKDAMSDMTVSTKMIKTELSGLPGVIQQISNKIKTLGVYWFATMFSPMDLYQYGKKWFDYAKQYDDSLTSMRKVSNESIGTLQAFQKESFELADAVGTTASQLQNSTTDFLRLGESLNQAKQSAQEANILYNVSEFDNIEDATNSLISMSQAYDELEKMDIIDKLNIVGNNYAIATDELALALQNSASALKVAGNDIDESIALATAANTVIQDYSKVSAGIRTVSMRITGATSEELEKAGEDTDGLIETTAKLEDQVKSLTAVNGKMGISLLDANGNFRSTYDILLDIAEIWDEIGEQDKLDGNNRQNVLLESLAGKNRASILAAILQNPDILKSVYETSSYESNGSAQQELEKQLESISGHVAKLQNQWQNLWAETANRDVINWFLDLATSILKLADNFGIVKTLLVGGGGIFAALKMSKGDGRLKMSSLNHKYAVYNKRPCGYTSFLIMLCEIHIDKRSLNMLGSGLTPWYSPIMAT